MLEDGYLSDRAIDKAIVDAQRAVSAVPALGRVAAAAPAPAPVDEDVLERIANALEALVSLARGFAAQAGVEAIDDDE